MKKKRLNFRLMPASWGLEGDAYAIAEAHYYYEGEELERALAQIKHRDNALVLTKTLLEIDKRYGRIDAFSFDCKLAELEILDPRDLLLKQIDIEVGHQRTSPYDAARRKVDILHPAGVEREIALLELKMKFEHITRHEFEKQRATLREEPWVAIIDSGYDPERGIDGVFFEFDWNAKWIEFLKLNGYVGYSDEQVVDDWFSDVCRSHTVAADLAPSLNHG